MTEQVWTSWLTLGSVRLDQGPLFVVEGSNRFADHVAGMRGFDLERDRATRRATIAPCPIDFARARGTRLLTGAFDAGDVLLFDMFLIHGAFDHRAADVRVTCDVRWQPAAEPRDPRYFGRHPTGSFGGAYGELNGAKPLTDDWHQR